MAKKRNIVPLIVDVDFFDKVFEPARKNAMKKLGLSKLGQREFSKMMFKSKMNLNIKLNTKRIINVKKIKL